MLTNAHFALLQIVNNYLTGFFLSFTLIRILSKSSIVPLLTGSFYVAIVAVFFSGFCSEKKKVSLWRFPSVLRFLQFKAMYSTVVVSRIGQRKSGSPTNFQNQRVGSCGEAENTHSVTDPNKIWIFFLSSRVRHRRQILNYLCFVQLSILFISINFSTFFRTKFRFCSL